MKRLIRKSQFVGIVLVTLLTFGMISCLGLQIVKPGPAELAELAWSAGELTITFLPEKYRAEFVMWRPELENLKDALEAHEPITGKFVQDALLGRFSSYVIAAIQESTEISGPQREALVASFQRSLGIIHLEGQLILTPEQETIVYGGVCGILSGMDMVQLRIMMGG